MAFDIMQKVGKELRPSLPEALNSSSWKGLNLLEALMIIVLFASLFTSKPGLYSATICLAIYGIYLAIKSYEFRNFVSKESVVKLSFIAYFVGFLVSFFHDLPVDSILLYLRKSSFLVTFPLVYFLLHRNESLRKVAVASSVIGITLALLYSTTKAYALEQNLIFIKRVDSFWDVGRWSEILAYSMLMLLPLIFSYKENKHRVLCVVALLTLFLFLLLSGSRAPILAVAIFTVLFILYKSRAALLALMLGTVVFCSAMYALNPQITDSLSSRLSTITDTQKLPSNVARLRMWSEAIDFASHNAINDPKTFLLGTGLNNLKQNFFEYLLEQGKVATLKKETRNKFSFSDHHNGPLDNLNKMGVIYFAFFYAFILSVFISALKFKNRTATECSLLAISSFIFVGVFYSNAMEFQTMALFSLLALSFSYKNTDN